MQIYALSYTLYHKSHLPKKAQDQKKKNKQPNLPILPENHPNCLNARQKRRKRKKSENNPVLLKGGQDSAADKTPSDALLFFFLITTPPKTYTINQKLKLKLKED